MAQKGPTFFFSTFQVLIYQIGVKRIKFGKFKLQIQLDHKVFFFMSTPKSNRWTLLLFLLYTETVYIRIQENVMNIAFSSIKIKMAIKG